VDGAANAALVAWLADQLGLAKRDLRVQQGAAARRKRVLLDVAPAHVAAWLSRVLNSTP
jgi:uncharacterized protein YggU (UPF0235/DUF167 family)